MLTILTGIPGKLTTLLTRLSATWAAKVDTLHDTRITSARASYLDNLSGGAVALASNYTATRAGYLDKLNISGSALSTTNPIVAAPIATNFYATQWSGADNTSNTSSIVTNGLTLATAAASTSELDLVNITGAGVIRGALVSGLGKNAVTTTVTFRLYIDGTLIATLSGSTQTLLGYHNFRLFIGSAVSQSYWDGSQVVTQHNIVADDSIPFSSSFRITAQGANASNYSGSEVYYRIRRTA